MLISLLLSSLSFTATATPFDYAAWRATATAAERAEAVAEYTYALEGWTHDRSFRGFIYRDQTGRSWGQEPSVSVPESAWDEANAFEPQIASAGEGMVRLELDFAERFHLQPPQVWGSFYILSYHQHRLGPRPAQATIEYLDELADRVGAISLSLKNWLVWHVNRRWTAFADWNYAAESVGEWRRRTWREGQLYHPDDQWSEVNSDPTDALVALEETVRQRFNLTHEQNWEHVHRLLRSYQNEVWSSLHRPRRYPPEPAGYREAMLDGIRVISALAHLRLTSRLERERQPELRFDVDQHGSPMALLAAEREFYDELSKTTIEANVVDRFFTRVFKSKFRLAHVAVPPDPAVAEELGARLIHARLEYAPCERELEAPPRAE